MKTKISRRSFIRNTSLTGLGAIVIPQFMNQNIMAAVNPVTNYPDISVIESSDCFKATQEAINSLGTMSRFVKKGSSVGLLINSPWKNIGTYTNPDIALAVVQMCYKAGAKTVYTLAQYEDDYWMRGNYGQKFATTIHKLKKGSGHIIKEIPDGKLLKKAEVVKEFFDCNVIINIPIAKHHEGSNFTCNLKNMMGLCPYTTNRFLHSESGDFTYANVEHLSQSIVDLNKLRKPDLCVADVTEVLISNGPAGPGDLLKLQKVVAGTDPVSVDAYCANLIGLDPNNILMIQLASLDGIGKADINSLIIKAGSC
jgi:uncharacterized protein (DUF362 family)